MQADDQPISMPLDLRRKLGIPNAGASYFIPDCPHDNTKHSRLLADWECGRCWLADISLIESNRTDGTVGAAESESAPQL